MFQTDCTIFSMLFSKQKAIQKVTIAFSRLIYVTFSRVNDRSHGHDVLFDYNNCGVTGRSSIQTQTPSHIFYTMISDIAGQCLAAKRKVYTFKNEWECYKIQTSPISDWVSAKEGITCNQVLSSTDQYTGGRELQCFI